MFARGQIDEAKDVFQQVLADDPDCVEALNNLGVIAVQQGDFDAGRQHIGRVLELRPNFLPALGNLAVIHKHDQNWAGVVECLEPAIQQDPANLAILNLLGLAYLRCERFDEGRATLVKSLEMESAQPTIRELLETLDGLRASDAEQIITLNSLEEEPVLPDQPTAPAVPVQFGKPSNN